MECERPSSSLLRSIGAATRDLSAWKMREVRCHKGSERMKDGRGRCHKVHERMEDERGAVSQGT